MYKEELLGELQKLVLLPDYVELVHGYTRSCSQAQLEGGRSRSCSRSFRTRAQNKIVLGVAIAHLVMIVGIFSLEYHVITTFGGETHRP